MPTIQTQDRISDALILSRVLTNGESGLTPEVARYLLSVSFTEEDKARMHELAVKNRAGNISPQELDELDSYIKAGDILAILQSKARLILKKSKRR
jgi:hypothetical protein